LLLFVVATIGVVDVGVVDDDTKGGDGSDAFALAALAFGLAFFALLIGIEK
jgi:hypothetical protein